MALTSAEKQRAYRDRERVKIEALRKAANGAASHGNVTGDPDDAARIAVLEAELARANAAVVGLRQDNFRLASEVRAWKARADRATLPTATQQKAEADDHKTDEVGNVTDLAAIKAELDGLCMTITGMLKAPGEIDLYRNILPLLGKARPLVVKGVRKSSDRKKAAKARDKAWDDFLATIKTPLAGGMTQLFIKAMRRHTGSR